MPRAEAGSVKAVANAIKAKGLGRLRWYCQVCQKQCRDENGFKMHTQSESHLRQMLVVGENAGKALDEFSRQFQNDFIHLLSRRYNTQRVRANQVYNEYIQDKHHLHMNATKWVTLTEFVKWLGREGLVRADENEKGWWISWIDNSPKALARQAALQKKERSDMDEEQRQRKQLQEQIERARLQAEATAKAAGLDAPKDQGLHKSDGEKVSLNLFGALKQDTAPETLKVGETKPGADSTQSAESPPTSAPPQPAAPQKLSISTGGLKRPASGFNVFKQAAKAQKTSSMNTPSHESSKAEKSDAVDMKKNLAKKSFLTAAEKLMLEDMERERRKKDRGPSHGGYQGMGPTRVGR